MHTHIVQIQYIIQHAYIMTSPEFSAKMDVERKINFT